MSEQRYTITEPIVGPGDPASGYHLVDYQTQELVSRLWSQYLAQVRAGLAPSPVVPAMRRVSYALDSEAKPGDRLVRGIRMAGRSRRACTFEAALWHEDSGRNVHVAEMVTVFVDPAKGAVEIPDDFWAAVEALEGRSFEIPDSQAQKAK